jgi:hypothetical protein
LKKLVSLVIVLFALLIVESGVIVAVYPRPGNPTNRVVEFSRTSQETLTVPYDKFNWPIANNSDYSLKTNYDGSWIVSILSQLVTSSTSHDLQTEAQIALGPEAPSERALTPTIIVQERADGLLRVEYFAQNWPNSYGLLLYNSTSPGWLETRNVTLKFVSFGPAAAVNPQLAPRPNGNLTLMIGNKVVVDSYPIGWASLSSVYVYGLQGSTFRSGSVEMTFYGIKPKS